MLRTQPDALVSNRAPKEDERLGVQFATGMGQLIEVAGLADVDPSD
jgi:hypothetical protein